MALKPCLGCGQLSNGSRCPACTRRHHTARYGPEHQQLRAMWAPIVASGGIVCSRFGCGRVIELGEPWDLGHDDDNPSQYAGPEHVRCNRSTAGRNR